MEGLCGNCDGDADNDLGQSDEEVRKFGLGWRAPRTELEVLDIQEDNCVEKPKDECWPLPPDQDPCFKIMDDMKFGKVIIIKTKDSMRQTVICILHDNLIRIRHISFRSVCM